MWRKRVGDHPALDLADRKKGRTSAGRKPVIRLKTADTRKKGYRKLSDTSWTSSAGGFILKLVGATVYSPAEEKDAGIDPGTDKGENEPQTHLSLLALTLERP